MTLADLLLTLRQQLIYLLEQKAQEELNRLHVTFGVLSDASHSYQNQTLSILLEDLEYAAQHGVMGFWHQAKASIPTIEAIRIACSPVVHQPQS